MTFKPGGNVGIGTTNPQYKLAVNGNIGAQDIIVTNTGWSDYVFRPGYRLRPLSEVSQFIQKNGHLPDIPTEAEVKEKGVSLGDMQAKLLAKVEELTLHMIQQEKENRELRDQIQELRERPRLAQAAVFLIPYSDRIRHPAEAKEITDEEEIAHFDDDSAGARIHGGRGGYYG
jgi:hypothetical protein